MNKVAASTSNFAFVDWLRGIAALFVVYFHFDLHVINNYPNSTITLGSFTDYFVFGHFDLGKYAVAVFFMVSGFLIPVTLTGSGATLHRFMTHRFFRLYPAYWVSVLVFVLVELTVGRGKLVNWMNVTINLTMLQKFVGVPDVVGAYWTLQIELIFYAVCVLLFVTSRLIQREKLIVVALLTGLACGAVRYQTGKQLPVALCIALALMFLGDGLRALAERRTSLNRVAVMVITVAIALIPITMLSYKEESMRYQLTYFAAIGTFIGIFALRQRIELAVFANRIGSFLADCSYGVYLLHGSVGMAIGHAVFLATGNAVWTGFAMFGSTYLLAYAAYFCVERPCIRLGRRIANRRGNVAQRATDQLQKHVVVK